MRVLIVLAAFFVVGSLANPLPQLSHKPTLQEIVRGGEVLGDVMFIAGSEIIAPMMDATLRILDIATRHGKSSLDNMNEVVHSLHSTPELQEFVKKIDSEIKSLELNLDQFQKTARLTAYLVKATAECVAPEHALLDKFRAETLKDVEDMAEIERDTVRNVLAASNVMEEEVIRLTEIEDKVMAVMIATGDEEKAALEAKRHQHEAKKNVKAIQRTLLGVTDELNHEVARALEKIGETLEHVQLDGAKLLHTVENCLKPKMDEQLNIAKFVMLPQ